MTVLRYLFAPILALIVMAGPAFAQTPLIVDVTEGTLDPTPIAIPDFLGEDNREAEIGADISRVISSLDVDEVGLDSLDRRYLRVLIDGFGGGPAGVETLAAACAEARDALEDVVEPFLIQQGFIMRTPRGRVAAKRAYEHLGFTMPRHLSDDLFGEGK